MRILRSNKPTELGTNTVTFGVDGENPKTVKIRKVVVVHWKELFDVVQSLPQLIISVISARPEERVAYLVVALEHALDDLIRVVSVLTGLEEDYLKQNASLDELVTFFVETAKVNNFNALLKNVRGVLNLAKPEVETETDQDAN